MHYYCNIFLLILLYCEKCVIFSFPMEDGPVPVQLSPVIFVPGDGGSQVDARLDKPSVVHYICDKKTDNWFNIWLNMELLVPYVIDCFIDNVKLYYDNVTRTTHNAPGVELRIPGWGNSEVVEYIDPSKASKGAYFINIADGLVTALGYERRRNLKGAPYDFRKAPNENKDWFINMKKLVEDTYQQNNNTRVTLVTHSMGSPMTLLLLQYQSQEWKTKYIRRMISIAGAWAGTFKAVKVFAMGDDLGAFALSAKTMRDQQISSPSLAYLLPSPYFWKDGEVLIQTPGKNYTFSELEQYFNDINYPTAWEMRKDNIKYVSNFSPPDVELHCIYSTGLPTVEGLIYKTNDIANEVPKLIYGDGDGTVNSRSLQSCNQWKALQKPEIKSIEVSNAEHMKILADERVIKTIQDIMRYG
ncbi:phospholipase A2 group XV-like [Condylostylus longicornis]|uniref:phospholipase A2 group XV-like n=1 Tax=Condylostylus longicornis TaxID=2530218 RepID=UPI00244E4366|nr:phospholipase A2 group XV-like [Condylostylus longicornis]